MTLSILYCCCSTRHLCLIKMEMFCFLIRPFTVTLSASVRDYGNEGPIEWPFCLLSNWVTSALAEQWHKLIRWRPPTHRPGSNQQPTAFIPPLCCLSSDPFGRKVESESPQTLQVAWCVSSLRGETKDILVVVPEWVGERKEVKLVVSGKHQSPRQSNRVEWEFKA